MKREVRKQIKEDLITQLERAGHFDAYYLDLVDHYMEFVDLKEKLQRDIKKYGLRKECINGNGIPTEKANESIERLVKVSAQMLKLLSELGLKTPRKEIEDEDL